MHRISRRRTIPVTIAAASAMLAAAWTAAPESHADTTPTVPPFHISNGPNFTLLPAPLSTSQCRAAYGIDCYGANQLQAAYNVGPLLRKGLDGTGKTIVMLIPYSSPTLQHDLDVYDRQFGLPDTKLEFRQFAPMPTYNPHDFMHVMSAAGITWQVELAHSIAPGAKIIIAQVGAKDDISVPQVGIPEGMRAEQIMVEEGVGDIFQQMFSTAEDTFPGGDTFSGLQKLRYALLSSDAHHVTNTAPAGDYGVTEFDASGHLYKRPSVLWPATDPLVTAVGGAEFYLNDAGQTLASPTGWNSDFGGAGSGGLSDLFKAPSYQAGVSSVVGNRRGIPDISGSGAVNGGSWIYTSFDASAWGGNPAAGWNIFDGTGGATAEFSAIIAIADQMAGRRLGLVNPALYQLGYRSEHGDTSTGIVPITEGDNSLGGVTGYKAGPGYDLDTGWGTIDAAKFVPALIDQIDRMEHRR
ncbi:S53 family peptidase [Jatrophihabitans sp.]|jgi:subtilase family serine protease|uniref:S53 family peptidase n=1 Tax=Jatrophihabitans sp. TaxID=1932789 RepID=UPI002F13F778